MDVNNYKLIVVIVKKGQASKILQSAKQSGAQRGTILMGRGTAKRNIYEKILGMEVEPEKEVVLIALDSSLVDKILDRVSKAGNLAKPGSGIAFVLNLKKCIGLSEILKFM